MLSGQPSNFIGTRNILAAGYTVLTCVREGVVSPPAEAGSHRGESDCGLNRCREPRPLEHGGGQLVLV
ncbi:hypothetical protein ACK4P7_09570 [Proteus mirabilis]|uniref:hypothetical protein n=1 Tax=Proteus mirabilis TaxID=584 RepID=UPI00235EA9D4|nr:hypothetical protein [Proteus mirabilis]MDC9738880.1 hypothetical protein [Proteus mirabilis]MDC9745820.1 hypothetical protein [Proteus mirabilis]